MRSKQSFIYLFFAGCFFIPAILHAQLKPFAGVYLTIDAEGYYVGPSYQLGADYHTSDQFAFSGYGQYFFVDYQDHSFTSFTVGMLLQWHPGPKKRFYLAPGIVWQKIDEDYFGDGINRQGLIPALRLGYRLPLPNFYVCPDISLQGPYHTEYGVELFTTPGIGIRLVFR